MKAVMVFQVEPSDYLMPLIQEWPTPRKSAETVIVRKDNRNGAKMVEYMSGLKYRDKKDTIYSIIADNPELVSTKAISGYEGIIEGVKIPILSEPLNVSEPLNGGQRLFRQI